MSIVIAALFMGIGMKMNEIGKAKGGSAPPAEVLSFYQIIF